MTRSSTTINASGPPDLKAYLDGADQIVDALPWKLGHTEAQHKRARGRASALAHQIAALLASGWTIDELRNALADASNGCRAPNAAAQEKLWRTTLKRANRARKSASDPDPRIGICHRVA
ncbi:hypothetical protein QTQ03_29900 [Micromonospora sp. WMMA1363]|uniref:hypothetical protein n=1 Tax=Micromonospora sp. WMMA1363 TaxID=3053985 RepID=UPI00259CD37F|nr:hypothetical protein [Micromonospora sp. WMMA1363]MDM4723560.1 hypothetical protein [Micromonospora sp. WMMA1363]MDM4723580.1 hypothetical protein [Micromonospora sp. WMMA1363]